jgi:hypothetical protein
MHAQASEGARMNVTDSKLGLVRKLLAKAESTDSAPERDALNERAAELIATYGIDAAMLAESQPGTDQIIDRSIELRRPFARDMGDLLWAITGALRVKGIRTKRWDSRLGPDSGGWSFQMRLFGYESRHPGLREPGGLPPVVPGRFQPDRRLPAPHGRACRAGQD